MQIEKNKKSVKQRKYLWFLLLLVCFIGILFLYLSKAKPGEAMHFTQNNTNEILNNNILANAVIDRGLLMPGMSGQDQSRNYYLLLAERRFSEEKEYLGLKYPERDFYQYVEMWKLYFYAYQFSNDIKYAEKSILELQTILETKSVDELCTDLQVFSILHIATKKRLEPIYVRLFQKLNELAKEEPKQLDGAVLYYCGVLMYQFEQAKHWRDIGIKKLKEGTDINNSYQSVLICNLLINSFYFAKQYSLPIEETIYDKAYLASYELMMRLEPDGSPPCVKGMFKRINYRETIWRAAFLFDLDDLRFVAYNGLQNNDIQPPANLNEFFEKTKTVIFRDTWNIAWMSSYLAENKEIMEGNFQSWLGQDTTQVTIELKDNVLHLFSFNKPQLMVNFPNELLSNCLDGVIENTEKLSVWSSKQKGIKISFIKEEKPIVLIESTTALTKVDLQFYHCDVSVRNINSNIDCLITKQSAWKGAGIGQIKTKERGFLKINSDAVFNDVIIDNSPKYKGYQRKVSIENCSYLNIECNLEK
jgi:hypothetical protein